MYSFFFTLLLAVNVAVTLTSAARSYDLPEYKVLPLSSNAIYRQDVCDRHEAFYNGTISLNDALKGLQLRPLFFALDNNLSPVKDVSGKISKTSKVPAIRVMDEIATRAGFTWRNSYGVAPVPRFGAKNATDNETENNELVSKGPTIDDLLRWGVETFDLVPMGIVKTASRASKGISSFEGYIESSIIMIGIKPEAKTSVGLLTFLHPFDWQVWLLSIFTMIVAAITYQFMEWINDGDSDQQELSNDPAQNLFFSFMAFTGDCRYEPNTTYSRIFVTVLAFWGLILSSAYTANLASFLVVQNTPVREVESVGEAVAAKYTICALDSGAPAQEVQRAFPQANMILVPPQDSQDIFGKVLNGDCTIAVTTMNEWEMAKINGEINPDCSLEWIGRTFKFARAGFVGMSDSGELCSNLIRDVFGVHITTMIDDGTIDEIMEDYRKSIRSNVCGDFLTSTSSEGGSENIQSLSLRDLGGLFIVVYAIWFLACVLAIAASCLRKGIRKRKQRMTMRASGAADLRLETESGINNGIYTRTTNGSLSKGTSLDIDEDRVVSERDELTKKFADMVSQMEEFQNLLQKGKPTP